MELFARLNGESQLALNLDENLSLLKAGFERAGKNRLVSAKFGFLVTSPPSDSIGTLWNTIDKIVYNRASNSYECQIYETVYYITVI